VHRTVRSTGKSGGTATGTVRFNFARRNPAVPIGEDVDVKEITVVPSNPLIQYSRFIEARKKFEI
jgi:hypothetical protein